MADQGSVGPGIAQSADITETVPETGRLARTIAPLRVAATNPSIARAVVAFGGFTVSEWAIWIAMLVYAYQQGGASAAGFVAVVQLLPSAFLSPVIAGFGDRLPRERMLVASYVAQAAGMTATAVGLWSGAPFGVVVALAAVTTIGIGMTRPAHFALLPALARTADEVTAANVASSTIQSVAILVAPALAGVILAVWGAAAVFGLAAAIVAGSAGLVAMVRTERMELARPFPAAVASPEAVTVSAGTTAIAEGHHEATAGDDSGDEDEEVGLIDGLRLLRRHVGTRTIVVLIGAGSIIEGSLDVIGVVLALDLLGIGETGVGILGSAVGMGGLVGAVLAASLVGRRRLAGPFAIGLCVWGAPLAIIGLLPLPAIALGLFVVCGIGRSVMDVAGRTLLQRVSPHALLGGVLGSLEGLHDLMLAVGSIAVPLLIALFGSRGAIILTGLWLPIIVLVAWRQVVAADGHAIVHVRELARLRALPMFAPLPPPTIEWMAAHLRELEVDAGTAVVREGQVGDRFYLVDRGACEVTIGDRAIRRLGPGDGFGEIALLRRVPRTASVWAIEPTALLALGRDAFLRAVTGHVGSRAVAADLVASRLHGDVEAGVSPGAGTDTPA
jgi:MFS family permease